MEDDKIKDIPSFLKRIKSLHSISVEGVSFECNNLYYRGQADSTWKIKAGLFREEDYTPNEYEMLTKANAIAYRYLKDCKTALEKVIVMQHYGLKTRLLDITTNPLVALYFACCSESGKDGVVYSGYNELQSPLIANLILEIAFEKNCDIFNKVYFEFLAKKVSDAQCVSISTETLINFLSNTQYIYAPLNSERIIAQSGAFIVVPLLKGAMPSFSEEEDKKYTIINSHEFQIGEGNVFSEKIIIDKTKKQDILNELSEIGINEASLFPEMDHLMNYVSEIHRGRFRIACE